MHVLALTHFEPIVYMEDILCRFSTLKMSYRIETVTDDEAQSLHLNVPRRLLNGSYMQH